MNDADHEFEVDVAVIGAGSARLVAFRQASKHTDKVVLIDRGRYDTTCARVGCMSSKLLISAADEGGIAGANAGSYPKAHTALHDKLKLGPKSVEECMDCGPGT